MSQADAVPISALNQYAYCPRRSFLIHGEGEFTDNIHTVSGTREHERVDQLKHETKAGVRVEFGLPVWSERLGLTGKCDVVEFHPEGAVYPVEYKHGPRRRWLNDDLQLGAQALCLEEMLGRPAPRAPSFTRDQSADGRFRSTKHYARRSRPPRPQFICCSIEALLLRRSMTLGGAANAR